MVDMPNRKLLKQSKAFCMAPWVHLHVSAQGEVAACCEADGAFANINAAPLPAIWNGEQLAAFRAGLGRDQRDSRCWKCYDKEAVGGRSLRHRFNERYGHHFDWVEETSAAGVTTKARPVYWDIRFSNICNFRCRSCWHGASSRWFEDAVDLGTQASETAIIRGVEAPDRLLDELDGFLPDVEEIYFAGGEPLIMEEHYRILQALDRQRLYNVRLRYNTNFSEMAFKDLHVLDLWRNFNDVTVWASVDGVGARGELIRKEQSWTQFLDNRTAMKARCPDAWFGIHTTVSVMNILHLPEMQRHLVEEGVVDLGNCEFEPLQVPQHYNIRILPRSLKRKAVGHLEAHKRWIRNHVAEQGLEPDIVDQQIRHFDNLVAFMSGEDWSDKTTKFATVTEQLDQLRGERTVEVIPELAPLLSHGRRAGRLRRLARRVTQTLTGA